MKKKNNLQAKMIYKLLASLLILIILVIVIVPSAGISLFLSRHVSYQETPTTGHALQGIYKASDYGLSENVHIFETTDGESLWCSEITAERPKGVIIYLTGIVQPSITYFYSHAAWMKENGYSSLLLEVRGHGKSSGKQIGFGYTEIADVQAAVDYIHSKEEYSDVPIVLQGVSMGGAITLNAFGQIPEISGCIAMSPYASCEDELELLMVNYHIPSLIRIIERPLLKQTLKWLYSSDQVETLSPKKQIQNANGRPVYIVSCKNDDSVPVKNAEILKEAYPQAEVWIRDSWEHFILKDCNFKDMKQDTEYCKKILLWIETICNKK
ncbi:MAG: alpha/beta fold hydrolase [bacterium]|nr:alpha/beta fold hydrolase [bacterium]